MRYNGVMLYLVVASCHQHKVDEWMGAQEHSHEISTTILAIGQSRSWAERFAREYVEELGLEDLEVSGSYYEGERNGARIEINVVEAPLGDCHHLELRRGFVSYQID